MSRSKPKILMDSNSELQDRMGIEDQKAEVTVPNDSMSMKRSQDEDVQLEEMQFDPEKDPDRNMYDFMDGVEMTEIGEKADDVGQDDEALEMISQLTINDFEFNKPDAGTEKMDDEIDNLIIGMQEMLLKCEAEENLSVSEQSSSYVESTSSSSIDWPKQMDLDNIASHQKTFNRLNDAFPEPLPIEFPKYLYIICWDLEKNFDFVDFLERPIYVGIGNFTRTYDHFLLTKSYIALHEYVKKFDCIDLKHEEIKGMLEQNVKSLIIRVAMKSESAAHAIEFGVIKAFGLDNLVGNKVNGANTAIPLEFSISNVIDAARGLLYNVYRFLEKYLIEIAKQTPVIDAT